MEKTLSLKTWKTIGNWYIFLILILSGCNERQCLPQQSHDSSIKKTKDDFRSLTAAPCGAVTESSQLCPTSIKKDTLPPCLLQKVSLSLSGKIPLRDAFFELARQAKINIILHGAFPKANSIFYTANNQALADVLDTLCTSGGLRYYFEHDTIHICQDVPYFKTHNIQFLLGSRKTQTQVSIKTDILAEGLNSHSKGNENGASISLNSSHSVDFWEELEKNIALMLSKKLSSKSESSTYSLNKYGGILSVYGTEKQHLMIAKYLTQLQRLVTTQILIEAKIIEIDLHDDYKGGVNWSAFSVKAPYVVNPLAQVGQTILENTVSKKTPITFSSNNGEYSFRMENTHLNVLAEFMANFGTVRTLANPRLAVINNQSAVLKVAHNEVFFELQLQDNQNISGSTTILNQKAQSRIQTVPIGLILYVHPSVNFETGEILVSLHPTISRIIGVKSDPATSLNSSNSVISEVPIVQIREMDSVIVARENQIIVTGGLMEERSENNTKEVPGLSDIPLLGHLFQTKNNKRNMTELVILLKLSVINNQSNVMPADKRLYECFTNDPRPINLPK